MKTILFILFFTQVSHAAVIDLILKKKDGSIYWQEKFDSMNACNTWYKTEMTRAYWDKSITGACVDNSPPPPTAAEIAAQTKLLTDQNAKMAALKALANGVTLSAEDQQNAIKLLLQDYK